MQEALEKLEVKKLKKPESTGPLVGIVIIVAVLVLGGIYSIIKAQSRTPDRLPFITNDQSTTSTP